MENSVKSAEAEVKQQVADANEILRQLNEGLKTMKDLTDDERQELIDLYNEKNKGVAHLTTERATDELMAQTKKDFETYQDEYFKLSYEVCDKTHALEYAKFLEDWNENHTMFAQNYWVGGLKFDEVIKGIIKTLEEKPEENLEFDFAALTYTHILMMQPCGVGLAHARWMAENQEVYNAILNKLDDHMHTVELIKKKIGLLQQKWAMACQGFVCELDVDIKDLKSLENIRVENM